MKYYLVFIENNFEPTILGGFKSEESRDDMARDLKRKHGSKHGYFSLEVNSKGKLKMEAYHETNF